MTSVPAPSAPVGPEHFGIGGAPDRTGIEIAIVHEAAVALVLASRANADAAAGALAVLSSTRGASVRAAGPGSWYVVDANADEGTFLRRVGDSVGPAGAVVDQSSGRVLFRIEGEHAAAALSKVAFVDLFEASFPTGDSATTMAAGIGVHLHRTGPQSFELLVMRSYAESLIDRLKLACREYGYRVG